MLDFLHLFSDLQSLMAGIAVKSAHLYLPSMIEKSSFFVPLLKSRKNKLWVKDFKAAVNLKEGNDTFCPIVLEHVATFEAWKWLYFKVKRLASLA